MSSTAHSARASARLVQRYASRCAARRAFQSSARNRVAQNYKMPALSPTMTEGNIATWRIKEGESFTAGDVILEIETDKANMDVEAQDDGIVFKILEADGAKGVKVGQRIAVFADEGDDLDSLEMPADEESASKPQPEQKEESKPQQETSTSTEKQGSGEEKSAEPPTASPAKSDSLSQSTEKSQKQRYPLYPSVEQLLHQNGYSSAEADKITPTGPNGRLLKGDVLAYLGQIEKDYPSKQSQRLAKLAHLDLSNIKIAEKAPSETKTETPQAQAPEVPTETELAVPISLSAVIATQKRVQDSLGIFLPLSTFIARASELANEDLPASRSRKPSADELFNSVLGLDQVHKSSKGHFIPQVTGISPAPVVAKVLKKPDIIDFLAPKAAKKPAIRPAAVGISASANIFSVVAKPGDEARATAYLERIKLALEKEPGRLVL